MNYRKHPADMALSTLASYFYHIGNIPGPNYVFPIDNSEYVQTRRPNIQQEYDSRVRGDFIS